MSLGPFNVFPKTISHDSKGGTQRKKYAGGGREGGRGRKIRGGRGDATRFDVAPHRQVHRRDESACATAMRAMREGETMRERARGRERGTSRGVHARETDRS